MKPCCCSLVESITATTLCLWQFMCLSMFRDEARDRVAWSCDKIKAEDQVLAKYEYVCDNLQW